MSPYSERKLAALIEAQQVRYKSLEARELWLTTGVAAANAVGLLASFTAISNGGVCDVSAFTPVPTLFAAGFALAIVGHIWGFVFDLRVLHWTTKRRSSYESPLPQGDQAVEEGTRDLMDSEAIAKMNRPAFLSQFQYAFFFLAAILLVAGAMAPVTCPGIVDSLCAVGAVERVSTALPAAPR